MGESKHSLIQEEYLCEIIHNYSVIFDKSCKRYKERDAIACIGRNKKIPGGYT